MKKNIFLLLTISLFSLSTYGATLTTTAPNVGQITIKLKSVAISAIGKNLHIIIMSKKNSYDQSHSCNFSGKILRNVATMALYKEIKENINNPKYSVACHSKGNASGTATHRVVFLGTHANDVFTARASSN